MRNKIDPRKSRKFLEKWMRNNGVAGLAWIPLNDALAENLSGIFAKRNLTDYPEYVRKTSEIRKDPRKSREWAKSFIALAIPFDTLPPAPNPHPAITSHPDTNPPPIPFTGRIASYAGRLDYHIHSSRVLANLADALKTELDFEFQSESAVDTKPLAERPLAGLAGLGEIGRNQALRIPGYGSGCFLCELLTDIPLFWENLNISNYDNKRLDNCAECGRCVLACPTQALGNNSGGYEFDLRLCRSYLTMEKRGLLDKSERRLLGDWIFGCDECVLPCPDTNLPLSTGINLEWLLEASAGEIRRAIRGTAMEYAGVTLLRRNAIIALDNAGQPEALELISRFSRKTSSELLFRTSEIALKPSVELPNS